LENRRPFGAKEKFFENLLEKGVKTVAKISNLSYNKQAKFAYNLWKDG